MTYRSLKECTDDLRRHNLLIDIRTPVDPHLEAAEIHRRVFERSGPALLFHNLKNCRFPAVSNLFGTAERYRFIFGAQMEDCKRAIEIKADPKVLLRRPFRYWKAPWIAYTSLPQRVRTGPVMANTCTLSDLPQITSWPLDGGPFVTLPQVYSDSPTNTSSANIGMYRIQLAGNDYIPNQEIGLHYQIHRGLGIHHTEALRSGKPLRVAIFVGGPPAHTVAAVMPLPENLPETIFAGMLAGRRMRLAKKDGFTISTDADFCILGTVDPHRTKTEGPFGDHLGYYSLRHEFPFLNVHKVYHRTDAIWPFTVVGRPPQEDSSFGALIHEMTTPMVPVSLPGVHALHAVDFSGVHPLLFAVGSERYTPYQKTERPQELLTQAHAILGFNQCSLAKYLIIANHADGPNVHNEKAFLTHILERVDWRRDLHFQTQTTMDTLDYSGEAVNQGSKLVIAATGPKRRELADRFDTALASPWKRCHLISEGILLVEGPSYQDLVDLESSIQNLHIDAQQIPLVVIVDDLDEIGRSFPGFLWVCFTRSNPARDVYGIGAFTLHKHWGCHGSLVIDARIKTHHAPRLTISQELRDRVTVMMKSDPLLREFA